MYNTYAGQNRTDQTTEINEITILQEAFIKITDLRTIIGTITYSMSDITAVKVTKRAKSYKALWLVMAGLLFILWSIIDQTGQLFEFFNIGMVLNIVGIVSLITAKPTYAVQIQSPVGNYSILRSTNLTFIQRIADAMNTAIARRG